MEGDPKTSTEQSTVPGGVVALVELPPPHPTTSPPVSAHNDEILAGLPERGRDDAPIPPSGVAPRTPGFLYLCGLEGVPDPFKASPSFKPNFGGPGGPMVGRGRSQDRQRNLEFSREASTAGISSGLFSSLLESSPPPCEISAASLVGEDGGRHEGKGVERMLGGVRRDTNYLLKFTLWALIAIDSYCIESWRQRVHSTSPLSGPFSPYATIGFAPHNTYHDRPKALK